MFISRIVSIFLVVLCATVPVMSAEPDEHVLKTVPADVLFCARAKNLEYTASMIDQFLLGVSPMPLVTSMIMRTQLAKLFGDPELVGVNMAGSFAVFATVEPNQTIPDLYALIPITDYSRLTDVNTNVPTPDANGISTIMLKGKQLGCITKLGAYALLARDYATTLRMGKLLSAADTPTLFAALGPDGVKQADNDLIWAYGNIQKASKSYGSILFEKIEQLKNTMQTGANPNAAASPINPAFMIDGYSRLLKLLLNEGKSLTIAASPKPDLLLIKTAFKARSGTEMADILTADSATRRKNNLAGYLKDGAVMNFIVWTNHDFMKKFLPKTFDLMSQALGCDPNAADVAKFKNLSDELIDSMGNLYACSFLTDPNNKLSFFGGEYFHEIKDPDKFNKTIGEFIQAWAGSVFDDFYKKMGVKTAFSIERGVDNYKGISIDAATLDMNFGDGNSPQSQMLNNMYGKGFNYRWAIVNDLWVCKISSDPNAIYKLIDQVKTGPPAEMCSELKKAITLIPDADNQDFIATYNYIRLFKMMGAMMPMPLPAVDIPTKSNLVFAASVRNGGVTFDIAVPKEHLAEIMTMFMMMQQQQMQQMQQMQQQQPMTTPPPTGP